MDCIVYYIIPLDQKVLYVHSPYLIWITKYHIMFWKQCDFQPRISCGGGWLTKFCKRWKKAESKHMWCDQPKSIWSRSSSVLIFLTNCMHHFRSYILQKAPLKLVNWFQRYEQLKDAKNNRKQKTFSEHSVWLYLKINISDFWLILLDHITYV